MQTCSLPSLFSPSNFLGVTMLTPPMPVGCSSYDAEKFKVTIVVDSTSQIGSWASNAYAHVPVVCTIRGEPYSCSIDPPTVNVVEFLNKTRHEDIPIGTYVRVELCCGSPNLWCPPLAPVLSAYSPLTMCRPTVGGDCRAAPPVLAFKKVFEAALAIPDKPVLCVTLNKHMSATHGNALKAKAELSEADQKRVVVLDHGEQPFSGPCCGR